MVNKDDYNKVRRLEFDRQRTADARRVPLRADAGRRDKRFRRKSSRTRRPSPAILYEVAKAPAKTTHRPLAVGETYE